MNASHDHTPLPRSRWFRRAEMLPLPRIEDLAPPRAVERGRRAFLSWLAAGTAMYAVGCAGESEDETAGVADDALATDVNAEGCRVTTRDALGPYYEPGAPVQSVSIAEADEPGVPLLVEGRLVGPDCRTPLKHYVLDLWQASAAGQYSAGVAAAGRDFRLRGKVVTDAFGRYSFETVLPGRYRDAAGIRPAHIHVTFRTPGGSAPDHAALFRRRSVPWRRRLLHRAGRLQRGGRRPPPPAAKRRGFAAGRKARGLRCHPAEDLNRNGQTS